MNKNKRYKGIWKFLMWFSLIWVVVGFILIVQHLIDGRGFHWQAAYLTIGMLLMTFTAKREYSKLNKSYGE
ncbi:hypothetical protein [Pseudalkalibacillus berkeleyi]|uniref:Uncharacterized protein n=1 Tax=Pseudalkalibacillus berkeleyi TaxID=1069813 RepID=A0ABS9GXT5_9BACL|nr:hypothetical protein [Pseudalkalibacillus berkeleyi]MCF6136556.1 hypothetical protein [Pseudalkalibacillus berkeleyi]